MYSLAHLLDVPKGPFTGMPMTTCGLLSNFATVTQISYLIKMWIQSEWEIYTPITEEIGALCNELII